MQDKIESIVAGLTELKTKLDELGDLNEAYNKAEEELQQVRGDLNSVRVQLESGKAGLSAAQMKNLKDHETAVYDKRKELEALTERVKNAQGVLGDLQAQINSASGLHEQIEKSITAMRARFA